MIKVLRHFHDVNRQLDIHVAFDLATASGIGEFLGRFCDHGIAVVIKPIDKRANGGIFLIFNQRRVVKCTDQLTFLRKQFQKAFVINVKTKRTCRSVEVGAINKEPDPLLRVKNHHINSSNIKFKYAVPKKNGTPNVYRG